MTGCTHPLCQRRTAALQQLVDVLDPATDQRAAYEALPQVLGNAVAALVDVPQVVCKMCLRSKPATEFGRYGRGTSKSCTDCVSARAVQIHNKRKAAPGPSKPNPREAVKPAKPARSKGRDGKKFNGTGPVGGKQVHPNARTQACANCAHERPILAFAPDGDGGRKTTCRDCIRDEAA